MINQYTLRCCAIILLAAGYGWAGGHFIAAGVPLWAYAFQFVILLLLLVFAVGFLTAMAGPATSPVRLRRNARALTIFAALTLLINIANIIQGAFVKGPFGSHNTFADLVPIGMIIAGDTIWLLTLLRPFAGLRAAQ
jgi:cbb3-type cytochrome oxidase subunit 1